VSPVSMSHGQHKTFWGNRGSLFSGTCALIRYQHKGELHQENIDE
jgi:hypothetical protein